MAIKRNILAKDAGKREHANKTNPRNAIEAV